MGDIDDRTGARCESLEQLTFHDDNLDLFVTQDVLEHIFDVDAAFREIARVLRPGGAHIFSVPLVNKANPSQPRATRLKGGSIVHHFEPEYHGNPVDSNGSLMTMNWGYDIAGRILSSAGMPTIILQIDDLSAGIRAEFIDIVVSLKPSEPK